MPATIPKISWPGGVVPNVLDDDAARAVFADNARSGGEAFEELDELGEVAVAEELIVYPRPSGRSEPGSELAIVEESLDGCGEGIEIVGIVDQQTVPLVNDLVLDPTDATGNHRPRLPHCFGDGESKALDEALLHHDVGVALQRVDDDCVLIDIVHRNRGEVHAPWMDSGTVRQQRAALGEHVGTLRVVSHP